MKENPSACGHESEATIQVATLQPEIMLLCVRWDLRYPLRYRHLEEMMAERGLTVDHATIYRWVVHYAPELEKRCRLHLKWTNDSWRVNETYVRVKAKWTYLERAVDSAGNTIDFMLSAKRDKPAKRFFYKALKPNHSQEPRVINVDKNAAYPPVIEELKAESALAQRSKLCQTKYLNNLVEQDNRFIKKLVNPGLGFKSFYPARTLIGYEVMNSIKKGQLVGVSKRNILGQAEFVSQIFGVAA